MSRHEACWGGKAQLTIKWAGVLRKWFRIKTLLGISVNVVEFKNDLALRSNWRATSPPHGKRFGGRQGSLRSGPAITWGNMA